MSDPADADPLRAYRAELRSRLIAAREALPADRHAQLSQSIERHLGALVDVLAPAVLAFCWPFRDEFDARDLVTYSIPASAKDDVAIDACLRDLSDALSSFCPVVFGMFVDAGFELALPGSLISSIDDRAIVGGHAMTVLEYAPQAGYVVVDNWWDGWGDGDGLGYIDARLWARRACDVTAFVYAPPTS